MSDNYKRDWIIIRVLNPELCNKSHMHECGICLIDGCLLDEDPLIETVMTLCDTTREQAFKTLDEIIPVEMDCMDDPAPGWEYDILDGRLIECCKPDPETDSEESVYVYAYHVIPIGTIKTIV